MNEKKPTTPQFSKTNVPGVEQRDVRARDLVPYGHQGRQRGQCVLGQRVREGVRQAVAGTARGDGEEQAQRRQRLRQQANGVADFKLGLQAV